MWIARDLNGPIWVYKSKPNKNDDSYFSSSDTIGFQLHENYLQIFGIDNLTFENSPIEIEIKVKQ